MIQLFTSQEFQTAKRKDKLLLECECCHFTFLLPKSEILNTKRNSAQYCSRECASKSRVTKVACFCSHCKVELKIRPSQLSHKDRKTKNVFCNRSCAASYNNTHKKHGTRISKLEKWIAEKLNTLYPNLEIHYNRKDAINSELDIYIPSLKLAFELNGIYHYEPIHGQDKLDKTQNNDNRKFQACLEQGIELCIIDTSQHKYFKEIHNQKYLDIVVSVISNFDLHSI